MKAAYLKSVDDIVIRDCDLWPLEQNEIRIRVDACGICGTDVTAAVDGKAVYEPFGHEVAGTILETGIAVKHLAPGQQVLLESASACGQCVNCRNCRQELCTSIQSFFYKTSFGFAEEMISPAISAIPYDGLSPEEACMAEPLGVALDMLRLADIEIGSHVVVSGLGPIGLMALRLAKLSGAARVYGCELSSSAARIAKACEFGADEIILVDQQPLATYPFVQPPDRFLISSPPRSLVPFFDVAAKGAIFSFIGIEYGEGATVCFDLNEFHFKKLQLRASFASPALYTPAALELITRLREDFRSLITHTFPLSEIQAALKAAHQCERAIKVIVKP